MNPTRLKLGSFRSHDHVDLQIPEGITAITGANGSGKSSLLMGIECALFGPETRTLADYLNDSGESTELMCELTFDHGGRDYRVRRGFSGRGRGKSTLDFEKEVTPSAPSAAGSARNGSALQRDGQAEPTVTSGHPVEGRMAGPLAWTPLTRGTQAATQALIEQTIGLSRQTFRASCFLAQGDSGAFCEAAPRDRKQILAQVLGLEVWAQLLELVRRDKRAAETERQRIDAEAGYLQGEAEGRQELKETLASLHGRVAKLTADLEAAEYTLEDAGERVRAAKAATDEVERTRVAYRQASDELNRLVEATQRAEQAIADREAAEKELKMLATPEQATAAEEQYSEARAAYDRAALERDTLAAKATAADGLAADAGFEAQGLSAERDRLLTRIRDLENAPESGECAACGQPLTSEKAWRKTMERLRADVSALDQRIVELTDRAREQQARAVAAREERVSLRVLAVPDPTPVGEMRRQLLARATLTERLNSYQQTIILAPGADDVTDARARMDEAATTLRNLEQNAPDATQIAALQNVHLDAKAKVEQHRRSLQDATAEQAVTQDRLNRATAAQQKLAELAKRSEHLLDELGLLALLEQAFGPNGIPALIVENAAIPAIETEANRILGELGTPYRVQLRTQRALKSSDGLADTLDVVVLTDAGDRPYETFSGGERARLNVALRIALARLLAHRRGAESRVLILDELEFLDVQGQAALVDVLRGLGSEFDRILVVSHAAVLREAFDNVIELENVDGRSRIVGAPVAEAVAA